MPHESSRSKALRELLRRYEQAKRFFVVDQLLDDDDSGDIDLDSPSFLSYLQSKSNLRTRSNSRYFEERVVRRMKSMRVFEHDLQIKKIRKKTWLNDDEFKRKYRMSRENLDRVTEKIKDHSVFKRGKRGPRQTEVKHQLMVLLHFLGKEGESNDSQRSTFYIGGGSCEKFRDRVVEALCSLRDEYITWPDEKERKEIASRIESEYIFPNCIGMMDGTLAPLCIAPLCDDAADYSGRKFQYSLTIMVINDDKRRIRAYVSGFPGCTHDNRLWQHMDQCMTPEKFFSNVEYILGDTAFESSNHCISAYKAGAGFIHERPQEIFNTSLASPRVISEHTMGLWKGRFAWLRKIRMLITNNPDSLKRILMYIDATVVLHNMLIEFGDDSDDGVAWDVEDEELTRLDDAERVPTESGLSSSIPEWASKGTRREQLKNYICERYVPSFNVRPMVDIDDTSVLSDMSD